MAVTLPNNITPGSPRDIEPIMANFNYLKTILDGNITDEHLSADSVGTSELKTDAVETENIKALAVTGAKIAAATVAAANLATDAVETAKIKDDAVTIAKISTDAVPSVVWSDQTASGTISSGSYVDVASIDWTATGNGFLQIYAQTSLDTSDTSGIDLFFRLRNSNTSNVDTGTLNGTISQVQAMAVSGAVSSAHPMITSTTLAVTKDTVYYLRATASVANGGTADILANSTSVYAIFYPTS